MRERSHDPRAALGDLPPDYGTQVPGAVDAMAYALRGQGYRPLENDTSIRRKYETEIAAKVPELLRLREVNEATNFHAQLHPIHDAPFYARNIARTTGTVTLAAGATTVPAPATFTVAKKHVGFVRNIVATLISVGAATDMRISVLVNGSPFGDLFNIPLVVFSDIVTERNVFVRLLEDQTFAISLTNDGAGPHDVRVSYIGWQYTVPYLEETSRAFIPKEL